VETGARDHPGVSVAPAIAAPESTILIVPVIDHVFTGWVGVEGVVGAGVEAAELPPPPQPAAAVTRIVIGTNIRRFTAAHPTTAYNENSKRMKPMGIWLPADIQPEK
jgi:hypothetical protein